MPSFRRTTSPQRRGISLVETLISVVIMAMLMTGLASAFITSSDAIELNEQFFRATQAARVSLNQILVECRRADAVQCGNTSAYDYFDVIRPPHSREVNENFRRYAYDSANKRLTLTIHYLDGTTSSTWILVRNVDSATFGPPEIGTDSEGDSVVQQFPVELTIRIGKNVITLEGAAAPRRAMSH